MSETKNPGLDALESDILANVEAADTESALEAVRVAALGKKGVVSERMKTLGKMTPGRTQRNGAGAERAEDAPDRRH